MSTRSEGYFTHGNAPWQKNGKLCGCGHGARFHQREGCEACYCDKFESKEADDRLNLHGRFYPYRVPYQARKTRKRA